MKGSSNCMLYVSGILHSCILAVFIQVDSRTGKNVLFRSVQSLASDGSLCSLYIMTNESTVVTKHGV
jgi:hypothetical protein